MKNTEKHDDSHGNWRLIHTLLHTHWENFGAYPASVFSKHRYTFIVCSLPNQNYAVYMLTVNAFEEKFFSFIDFLQLISMPLFKFFLLF